jgi:hypothetical protein
MKKVLVMLMLICISFPAYTQDYQTTVTNMLDAMQIKYSQSDSAIKIIYTTGKDRQQSLIIYGFTSNYGWSESRWIAIVSPFFYIDNSVASDTAVAVLMNSMRVLTDRNPFYGIKLDKNTDKSGYYVAFISVDATTLTPVTLRNFMEALSIEADKLEEMFSEVDFY